jgi:hypothetical protein
MDLDVRLPMGSMFLIIGALLSAVGLLSQPDDYAVAMGINLNLWWGLVMLAVGATMLLLVWRAKPKDASQIPPTNS